MSAEENFEAESQDDVASTTPWRLRLYVNDRNSLRTIVTMQNLTELCEKHLAGQYQLEIIDLVEDFTKARQDQIMAIPTLVRRWPQPVRKVIGDLSNTSQVITALGIPGVDPYDC